MPTLGSINWTSKPIRNKRLLDWLAAHPNEREVLFSRRPKGVLTKKACMRLAAEAVFAVDADPALRARVVQDLDHLGQIVGDHMRKQWTIQYNKFNRNIGPAASRMRYKDIRKDHFLFKKVEKLMAEEFPEWSRLHLYWRELPQYNPYYSETRKTGLGSRSIMNCVSGTTDIQTTKRPSQLITKRDLATTRPNVPQDDSHSDQIVFIEDTDVPSQRNGSIRLGAEGDKENRMPFRPPASITSRNLNEHVERRKRRRSEYGSDEHVDGNDAFHGALTVAQRYDLRMAEIQLERQKLELECQGKKNEAERQRAQLEAEARRQREKHEIMMQLAAYVTGGAERDANIQELG